MNRQNIIQTQFLGQFDYVADVTCHGPGRVNLIGDHTDYNDGFVLPAAINFGTDIAASNRDDRIVRVTAIDLNEESIEFSLDSIEFNKDQMWVNYIGGTLLALMEEFPNIKGADLVVSGNVPQGAGLSSSASFEIAILKTFAKLNNLPLDGVKAALMGQKAENQFVGCNCGIMDQLISAMGKEDNAMLLDCRSLTFQHAPIPKGVSVVIINSNVKRGLVDSEYNTRREQCEAVAKHFGKVALRDVTLAELESAKSEIDSVLYKRARHVVTENTRTEQALIALRENDLQLMGELMLSSHASLREDFEVTTKEMDYLVDIIASVIGNQGGVRMTGGGFGGCVVALVPDGLVDGIKSVITKNYQQQTGLEADLYVCVAKSGAFSA
ncbi:galactokinase [Psychrosphaera sp. F3M07]|uniref:galactokinase n=1 Tax=Psychrosphaera sp. F3M07 TaxID=2841560 RepID=UPI001C09F677|nr:galactokinase [Psychrosphaera sp. F3M07]MBU2918860.1 galactokinase [Psychrosphaera sp. F3M07]